MPRITKRNLQNAFNAFAPERIAAKDLPKFLTDKPRKSSGKPRNHEEDDLQIAVCRYLDLLPHTLYWATPNHLMRNKSGSGAELGFLAKQKRMGVKRGFPDIGILFRSHKGNPVTCFAELKSATGKLNDQQIAWIKALNIMGHPAKVIRTIDELKDLLRSSGHPSVK